MKIGKKTVLDFTQNMHALLKSGLSLQQSLKVCEDSSKEKNMVFLCRTLLEQVQCGNRFSMALKKFENSFGLFYTELVRLGEESDSLCHMMGSLERVLKNKNAMRSKLIQALMYPTLVLVTAMAAAAVIVTVVFPKIGAVFEVFTENSVEVEMTLLKIKKSVTVLGGLCLAVFLLAFGIFAGWKNSLSFREKVDSILLRIPGIGRFFLVNAAESFVFVMKQMTAGGIPFCPALEKAASVCENLGFKKKLTGAYEKICEGKEIAESFRKENMPSCIVSWLKIGCETGNMEQVFDQLNIYFEERTGVYMSWFVNLVEPVLILVTGGFMFYVVAQFVLPVFSLLGKI